MLNPLTLDFDGVVIDKLPRKSIFYSAHPFDQH
jgi:hypothetical protein